MSKTLPRDYDTRWKYLQERFPDEYQRVLDFENGANEFLERIYELSKRCDELEQENEDLKSIIETMKG